MTTKFIHVRQVDEEGTIMAGGGLTIAWTANKDLDHIFVHFSQCSLRDQFSRKIGRELAAQRLKEAGPIELIPYNHPVSEAIRQWIQEYFDIFLYQDDRGRWVADFYTPNLNADEFMFPDPIPDYTEYAGD